ncbi:MAG TPA: DUF3488 and transglutaminase-like domain-containing protein, partial [Mycobacteriales bacterium]|nr:DUF3488 and transglutaminase-like domain-containing protein [Mycobacteriales bacterium]
MRTSTRMTLAAGWAVALGAVPLGAVFSEWRWIWYAWAAVGAVVGAHLLARSARLPAPLVPLAGGLGLLVYLTVVFAADAAPLGLVPTRGSLAVLRDALASGLADVNDMAAPVPATPGLVLLTAASVGGLAIVVDIVAVSLRRPAASGLALLALYAVPTAVRDDGVPWVLFAIGACGYLVLLLVEGRDRLLQWGRPVGAGQSRDEAALPLTGQRIGAAAIALAVIVPLFVPGLTGNTLSRLGRTGSGDSGNGSGGALNEFAALRGQLQRREPVELMRVSTDLDHPFYLRTKVLDRYQSSGFSGSRERGDESVPGGLSLPAGQPRASEERSYSTTISLTGNYSDDHLPLYYIPLSVQDVQGAWTYDADNAVVFSRARHGNFRYHVNGIVLEPSEASLAAAGAVTDADRRALPDAVFRRPALPGVLTSTVRELVGDKPTPYLKAKAINDYFTDGTRGFTYALSTVQGNSGSALVDFLTKKQGYCEQYAAAMAIMLRVADIPSRVVLGYTGGKRQDDGTYSVTTSDAHAWVEAYFHDLGWVPFDPTPLQDGRTAGLPYAPRPAATPTAGASATSTTTGSPGPTVNKLDPNDVQAGRNSGNSSDTALITPQRALIGTGVLAVLLALLAPAALRWAARRRRLRAAAGRDAAAAARAAWDEVVGTAADYGVRLPRTETPRGLARRLGRELSLGSSATAGLRLVALAEERARYAARPGVDGDLVTAVRAVRRGLREQADHGRRWRAVLLPPSTVQAARSGS